MLLPYWSRGSSERGRRHPDPCHLCGSLDEVTYSCFPCPGYCGRGSSEATVQPRQRVLQREWSGDLMWNVADGTDIGRKSVWIPAELNKMRIVCGLEKWSLFHAKNKSLSKVLAFGTSWSWYSLLHVRLFLHLFKSSTWLVCPETPRAFVLFVWVSVRILFICLCIQITTLANISKVTESAHGWLLITLHYTYIYGNHS